MLSYLYQLLRSFQRDHGVVPNVLYVNPQHYLQLTQNLPSFRTHAALCRFLALEVCIARDLAHPHVAWVRTAIRATAIG